jgi:hypothetical protein
MRKKEEFLRKEKAHEGLCALAFLARLCLND